MDTHKELLEALENCRRTAGNGAIPPSTRLELIRDIAGAAIGKAHSDARARAWAPELRSALGLLYASIGRDEKRPDTLKCSISYGSLAEINSLLDRVGGEEL